MKESNPSNIKNNLIKGVSSTVRWSECLENSTKNDSNVEFYEFGSTTLPKLKKHLNKSYCVDF